jgi:hypothetical protein
VKRIQGFEGSWVKGFLNLFIRLKKSLKKINVPSSYIFWYFTRPLESLTP